MVSFRDPDRKSSKSLTTAPESEPSSDPSGAQPAGKPPGPVGGEESGVKREGAERRPYSQLVRTNESNEGPGMTAGAGTVGSPFIARGTGGRLASRALELRGSCEEVVEESPDGSGSKMTCGVVETT